MTEPTESLVERVRRSGIRAASPVELLAISYSRRPSDAGMTELVAREMLKKYDRIGLIVDASFEEVRRDTGLEDFEYLRVQAAFELGRRAGRAEKGAPKDIEVPEDIYEMLEHLRYEKQEHFVVVLLDAKNRAIRYETVHIGTLTMSVVGPREVFRIAIREGASGIIVAHNHPSGDPTPSPEDLEVTKRLVEVGQILDIPVIDHVIIGDPRPVSFSRRGLL